MQIQLLKPKREINKYRKMTKDCTKPLRIGNIRALNGCAGRLFGAATLHNHKNSALSPRYLITYRSKAVVMLWFSLLLAIAASFGAVFTIFFMYVLIILNSVWMADWAAFEKSCSFG